MPNRLLPRRTATAAKVPTTADLMDGELAVNTTDKKFYIRVGAAIVELWRTVTKADVGLGNVDNTSDAAKPVSTAQAAALDTKVTAALATTVAAAALPADGGYQSGAVTVANMSSGGPLSFGTTITGRSSSDLRVGQLFFNAAAAPRLWFRTYHNTTGGWQGFVEVHHSGNFDPATKLGATATAADSTLVGGIHSTRIPFGANGTATSIVADMNTPTKSGFYERAPGGGVQNSANGADSWNWFMHHQHTNNSYGFQLSNIIGTNDLYVRGLIGGTWAGWNKLALTNSPTFTGYVGVNVAPESSDYARLKVGGGIRAAGAFGQFGWDDRSDGTQWALYANGGVSHIWNGTSNVVSIDGAGGIDVSDIRCVRKSAPATGVIYLGNSGTRYLFFDSANYQLPGAGLEVGGGVSAVSFACPAAAGAYFNGNGSGTQHNGAMYENGHTYKLAANGAAWIRNPRHFVQSTDPGAQAQDGDIWTNTA